MQHAITFGTFTAQYWSFTVATMRLSRSTMAKQFLHLRMSPGLYWRFAALTMTLSFGMSAPILKGFGPFCQDYLRLLYHVDG
jgi:hypothetical protein